MSEDFHWVSRNMDLVFLIYGAAFIFMGVAIFSHPKRGSDFRLAGIFWLLAIFGLIHGVNEWLDMLKLSRVSTFSGNIIGLICLFVSFIFLFEFGRRLVRITSDNSPAWQKMLAKLAGWKIYIFLMACLFVMVSIADNPILAAGIWSRYLFGFTGSILTGAGFILFYRNEKDKLSSLQVKRYFDLTTIAFVVYGVSSGLIVPKADHFPANTFNYDTFMATFDFPVQLARAIAAVFATFSIIKILKVFRWESDYRLEESLQRAQDALADVEKLSRRNKLILDSSGNGIIGVDIHGVCSFVNPAALNILDYTEQQLIGQTLGFALHGLDAENGLQENNIDFIMDAVIKGKIQINDDALFRCGDGSEVAVSYQVMPIHEKNIRYGAVLTFQDITQKKSSDRKIKILSSAIEQSPVSIVITDKKGNIEYVNPKFSGLTGYSHLDVIGKNPRILNSGNQTREFYEDMWGTISAGRQWQGELLNKKKNGELFWERALISPIVNSRNEVTNYVAVKEDITLRKKMEDEIRSTMQHLQLYRDQTPLGGIEWDGDFRVAGWNAAAERIFGYTFDEVKGKNPLEFLMRNEVVADVKEIWNALITQSGGASSINENTTKNGSVILCEWHNAPLINDAGQVVGVASVVQDVTERQQAERSLLRLNRSLRTLSACNEVLVRAENEEELLNNICHIIVDVTGYALAWVGYSDRNRTNINIVTQAVCKGGTHDELDMLSGKMVEHNHPAIKTIKTGVPQIFHRTLNQEQRDEPGSFNLHAGCNSLIVLPLHNKQETFGVLCIYANEEDVFNEDEIHLLIELANDLSYGIGTLRSAQERVQLNNQLQQAQKMETIGQLTGGIAHDFNNILASILGFTNMALQRFVTDDQPKLKEYLRHVVQAGERARDLVSQMLVFSRTGTDNAGPVHLLPVIKEVTNMLKATLPSSITLKMTIADDVPVMIINPVHIQQILMNLCINARDAIGDKGSIDIGVRVRETVKNDLSVNDDEHRDHPSGCLCDSCQDAIQEGGYIELSVSDTGSGIREDKLKRIFEPFFTTKDVGKGSGMGLSMVHGLVHKYGGHICVDTKEGQGTTFRLLFPLEDERIETSLDSQIQPDKISRELNGARILVVDDEESVAMFISDFLGSEGAVTTSVTDSKTALDMFAKGDVNYDLVITDQTMPGLTGVELAVKLLALRKDLPIILCTGYSEHVNEEKAMSVGIRGYITKPIETDVLIKMIRSLIP